ncbi:alkylhydroperoxidase AhpD family core domain-containing protein [Amycolatopsis marina]|uniref:Alkylhydroperoxidase AhpD family core domain-containing protein n=1 Tax=Amycolatopsis marina TaxID=490629 RepID=A0A1I0ZLL7_9PSEU|nr:carboxymuconolactone decarboxylase family protein [Amycolatopsis marina]SFB25410.1 alkylhydroperoxidase AhpD family core domain-containing protein [Amycolatopsis marina]
MAPAPIRFALRRTLTQIRYVQCVHPRAATGAVREVYRQVEQDFGMLAPPVALHSTAPGPLAASWMLLRETLLAAGETSRAAREAVAAEVSALNTCPYCVEVHTAAFTGASPDAADPELTAIVAWLRGTGGLATFSEPARAELTGVAVTFEYLNRMVNVFLGSSPFPAELPAAARRYARGLLARVLRPSCPGPPRGESLALLPQAPLPGDLAWAGADPVLSGAFARATAAIETAGRAALPHPVRDAVLHILSRWDGAPPELGQEWLESAVRTVGATSVKDTAAVRLAVLCAMASYRVDDRVVNEFRRSRPGDRTLVGAISWASLAGARRRGELLDGAARKEKTAPPLAKEN